jgi:hypothetical protein
MGGAGGQTLAGAISTGTHGMDKDMPPFADSVVALHLVGPGGIQYWIEPSEGISDPSKIKQFVAPDIDMNNIIYDDRTFEAILVSMGCMGIIYSVVLKVRDQYSLVETTSIDSWQRIRGTLTSIINDPSIRSLQIILDPYTDRNGSNLCFVTSRSEGIPPTTGPCKTGNPVLAVVNLGIALISNAGAIRTALAMREIISRLLLGSPHQQVLVDLINFVLITAPDLRRVLVDNYRNIMAESLLPDLFPPHPSTFRYTCGNVSYRVMDLENRDTLSTEIGGSSIEMFFPVTDSSGGLPFVSFINELITVFDSALDTFLGGYISIRFMGKTRACMGMQQWRQTCSVEVSTVPGINGMRALFDRLLIIMYKYGGKPHWGQELDLSFQGRGAIYPRFGEWLRVYYRMSKGFTLQTFENDFSKRWELTKEVNLSPMLAVTDRIVIVDTEIGSSATHKVNLSNTASYSLEIKKIFIENIAEPSAIIGIDTGIRYVLRTARGIRQPVFGLANPLITPLRIGAAGRSELELTFKPIEIGYHYADLVIECNDPVKPAFRIPISAKGIRTLKFKVTPLSIYYHTYKVGAEATRICTIENSDTIPFTIKNATLLVTKYRSSSNDQWSLLLPFELEPITRQPREQYFEVVTTTNNVILQPNDTHVITIKFKPTIKGEFVAECLIALEWSYRQQLSKEQQKITMSGKAD